MTIRIVHRPARITDALAEIDDLELAAPPQSADQQSGFPIQSLLPIVGSLGSITMMVVMRGNPLMVVVGALVLVVALLGGVGMAFTSRATQARMRRTQRERYLDYLERTRSDLRELGSAARESATMHLPDPRALVSIGSDAARRWERRPFDADFLRVRCGSADLPAVTVRMPRDENPVQPFDPIMKGAADRLLGRSGLVAGMPVSVDLSRGGQMSIIGERSATTSTARALAAQLATFHAPEEVHLAAAISPENLPDWYGFDLFPHVNRAATADAPVRRRVAPSVDELTESLSDEIADRVAYAAASRRAGRAEIPTRLVVFVDAGSGPADFPDPAATVSLAQAGITVIHLLDDRLREPSDVSARVTITDEGARIDYPRSDDDASIDGVRLDEVSAVLLEIVARPLAPLRLVRPSDAVVGAATLSVDADRLLGIDDVDNLDPALSWAPRDDADFLRVPIGVDDDGRAVLLDIKESAQLGMGPHGICIGATGSGKSELLRTLILELAMTHSPDDLSMILVDYKGGAAFAPFLRLPHVAGVIDNLADDPQLTERARASINGEVVRRQRVLKDAGNIASIGHYRQLRRERPELEPLPHLFLVIDEFGELLTAEPDFVDLLLTIGRIGRSIGVHLLLSSQRIEAGKLRGLDTYLSYRIGLRTFSEAESNVVLETPDAFHLPAVPGFGYLKVDTSVYERFRAGYVSGPVPTPPSADEEGAFDATPQILRLGAYDRPGVAGDDEDEAGSEPAGATAMTTGRTLVDTAVVRLARGAAPTRPVWLPPLPRRIALGQVLADFAPPEDGRARPLASVIGLLDDPATQAQSPWSLDLTRSGGHVSIMGAPQSGRSTFLRTLAMSLAFSRTPREVSIYGMDLTGGGLSRIEPFPHVGGVATRGHREKLERLLEELTRMMTVREDLFRREGLDSVADMRRRHARGELSELASADVVLLIDGYGGLRTDFEDLDPAVAALLERGSSFGIHVVMTMGRWNEMRMAQQSLVGTRLELKLNDPGDSQIARKLSTTLRADDPGRTLTDEKLFGQIALPLLEDVEGVDVGETLHALAAESASRWAGPEATPIRLLPQDLDPLALPDAFDEPDRIAVGLRQDTMQPLHLDLTSQDLHLVAFGDSQAGKTTLLRGVIQGALDRHSPEELVVALMDARGTLVGDVPEEYLGGHASSGKLARQLAESIAMELEQRQTTSAAGPRILVVADDFDILAAGATDPLYPLLPYLASARDLRLNVVVARPVAGAARAMYDASMQALRDTGGTTLIMSGDRSEGQLLPRVYAEPMVAGRGRLVRRGARPALVQIAHFTSDANDSDTRGDAPALTSATANPEGGSVAAVTAQESTEAPLRRHRREGGE